MTSPHEAILETKHYPGFSSQRTEIRSQKLPDNDLGKLKCSPFWRIVKIDNCLIIITGICLQASDSSFKDYSLDQIKEMSTSSVVAGAAESAIPTAYWPLYNELKKELRDNFDPRRQAAWILARPHASYPLEIKITQEGLSRPLRLDGGASHCPLLGCFPPC